VVVVLNRAVFVPDVVILGGGLCGISVPVVVVLKRAVFVPDVVILGGGLCGNISVPVVVIFKGVVFVPVVVIVVSGVRSKEEDCLLKRGGEGGISAWANASWLLANAS
jgi:hypothetical protein